MEPRSLKHSARVMYTHCLLDMFAAHKQSKRPLDSNALLESEEMLTYLLDRHAERVCVELMVCLAPPYLRQLVLKPTHSLSTQDVVLILHKCRHLSALSLEECEDLDVGQVVTLTRPLLTSLVTVNVSGCLAVTDKQVQDLLRTCGSLRHLILNNTSITDSAFLLHPALQNYLELTGQKRKDEQSGWQCQLSTANLSWMCKRKDGQSGWQCQLSTVDVSGCDNFTNTGLLHLASLTGPSLRSLLAQETKVDFYGLLYLSGHSKLSAKHFLRNLRHAACPTPVSTAANAAAEKGGRGGWGVES
ncbi:uncharacterized protein LOC143288762 [Babylonia areolata]|uniref:uncharacterized protein LOC143288762 n=1 Tax=Babylonia areolata TaxID=304850 RepID=UPI003FCF0A89